MSTKDQNLMKVILIASIIIVLSIVLAGTSVYIIAEKEVVNKLKSKDLVRIAESVASKIDGRLQRAKESSLMLAKDPELINWLAGGEKDEKLQSHVVEKLNDLATGFDYSNGFIASKATGKYWIENGQASKVLSESNASDQWFYKALVSKQQVTLNLDYDAVWHDTFVFVNVLVGKVDAPVGAAGIGLSLKELASNFKDYKYGANSNLWLIDNSGKIYLSDDLNHVGTSVSSLIPEQVVQQMLGQLKQVDPSGQQPVVLDYMDSEGQKMDLISFPLKSTDWKLLFQMRRSESVSFLDTIKINTGIASLLCILAMIFMFYFVTRNLANPYKRAMELNRKLEQAVQERTKQISEQKQKLIDSIDYAKRIQDSILPSREEIETVLKDHFVLWEPRDVVGGDFYWMKQTNNGYLLAIGDCTGHGVPGALMTMISISILNRIAETASAMDPASILQSMNMLIKETLHREHGDLMSDDGLDIGLCFIKGDQLTFAGAKTSLYMKNDQEMTVFKGDRKSIGSVRTNNEFNFTNAELTVTPDDSFYMTTDGYLDQNGGVKNVSFGRKKLIEMIEQFHDKPLEEQETLFRSQLVEYMGDEPQRDDITVLGFKIS
ncbi:Serine phosphatase RsbU, regulator of sigma subunit [Paenibacillus sp. 1_12]|uniref:SpoIIE family protein phosphatase n=1 Tax=Paenibacillus sp. 1_12 TaxID=1566278 RepID=UPI0008EC52D6|nr:SpoIIE family protein phosphatase [Paenibacillus sp. 1_12]SFL16972.1 Serine phosphatase RsbU, regulator of sigma subunit [Paenibacillus sp. 1_12]